MADHALHARASRFSGELVYSDDAPAVTYARAVDPVDAGKRAILDRGGERGFGIEVERQRQRGADRAAMRDGERAGPCTSIRGRVSPALATTVPIPYARSDCGGC